MTTLNDIATWISLRLTRNDCPCDPWDYEPDPRCALVVAQCRRLRLLKEIEALEAEIATLEENL